MRSTSILLLLTVSLLLALSFTMLASALMMESRFSNLVTTQAVAIVAGAAAMCLLWRADYRVWVKLHWWFYAGAIVILAMVLTPAGTYRNGAQRWIFGIQPGEFAKIPLLLTLAAWGARFGPRMRFGGTVSTLLWGLILPGLVVVPFLGLLYKQPDRGTTILFGMVTVVVLLLSGMRKLYAIIPTRLGAGLLFHFYNSSKMVRDRMDAFLHPELFPQTTGSQALKSLAARREGGLEGVGLGSGVIKLTIPEQHTDFILPVIGEELGLFFTLGVLISFVVILLCSVRIASRAADVEGRLLAGGIGFLIACQAMINIAVVTNSMINKGMPLPFVSRGGSSAVSMLALVGLLLSIARRAPEASQEPRRSGRNPFETSDLESLPAQ
ncbi:MAG: FtsW/RodA/SpoVE family cell cycle protein [Verrucomicrobia bacterium]|nr:FtsW/RodA/SpoVE family cell cycle protein [Verrucomicrobiota bacterium]